MCTLILFLFVLLSRPGNVGSIVLLLLGLTVDFIILKNTIWKKKHYRPGMEDEPIEYGSIVRYSDLQKRREQDRLNREDYDGPTYSSFSCEDSDGYDVLDNMLKSAITSNMSPFEEWLYESKGLLPVDLEELTPYEIEEIKREYNNQKSILDDYV